MDLTEIKMEITDEMIKITMGNIHILSVNREFFKDRMSLDQIVNTMYHLYTCFKKD
ncbi:hypothetical protein ES702_04968 [subsurface metagenome]